MTTVSSLVLMATVATLAAIVGCVMALVSFWCITEDEPEMAFGFLAVGVLLVSVGYWVGSTIDKVIPALKAGGWQ